MTDREIAMLKLEAWKALEGWGKTVELPEDDILRKAGVTTRVVPHDMETRCKSADALVTWMLTAPIYPGEERK